MFQKGAVRKSIWGDAGAAPIRAATASAGTFEFYLLLNSDTHFKFKQDNEFNQNLKDIRFLHKKLNKQRS